MNILVQVGYNADQEMTGVVNALRDAGQDVVTWSEKDIPAFNIFEDIKPGVFIGSAKLASRAIKKCLIKYKPKAAIYVDSTKPEDYENLKPDLLFSEVDKIISDELMPDVRRLSIYPSINMSVSMNPVANTKLNTDVVFVGSYHPTNRHNIHKYIFPLAESKLCSFRIYGHGEWPMPNALGILEYANIKNVMYNAKLYLYLTPNDTDFTWNPLLSVSVGTQVLTNSKKTYETLGSDYIKLIGDNYLEQVKDLLVNYNDDSKQARLRLGKDIIYGSYTNYHLAQSIMSSLDINLETKLQNALVKRIKND
jgi:hypothetical protein